MAVDELVAMPRRGCGPPERHHGDCRQRMSSAGPSVAIGLATSPRGIAPPLPKATSGPGPYWDQDSDRPLRVGQADQEYLVPEPDSRCQAGKPDLRQMQSPAVGTASARAFLRTTTGRSARAAGPIRRQSVRVQGVRTVVASAALVNGTAALGAVEFFRRSPAGRIATQATRPKITATSDYEEDDLNIPTESLLGNPPARLSGGGRWTRPIRPLASWPCRPRGSEDRRGLPPSSHRLSPSRQSLRPIPPHRRNRPWPRPLPPEPRSRSLGSLASIVS